MKRLVLLAIILLAVGCSKNTVEELGQKPVPRCILHGIIDEEDGGNDDTRVYLDDKIRIRWNEGDLISVWNGTTRNLKFEFLGIDGDSGGDFEDITSSIGSGNDIDRIYALYPYSNKASYQYGENDTPDYIRYPLPGEQTYKDGSIGLNSNLMVAITANKNDGTLIFRNVCSYLRLKLYGSNQTVGSVVFKGNNNEVLTGNVAITPVYGGSPTIEMLGNVEDENKTITLDCSDGVEIGTTKETATEFWMVIPPLNFPKGFTITVNGANGGSQEYVINNNLTFARNTYNTITRELTSAQIPNNEIWYTTSDGNYVNFNPSDSDGWGANTKNNTYTDGKGVITFDGDVTAIPDATMWDSGAERITSITIPNTVKSIGRLAFDGCTNLTSFVIPDGVTSIGSHAFSDCRSLTSITIPESVTFIGEGAFSLCSNIEEFKGKFVSDNVLIANNTLIAFPPKSSVTSYTIPNGVTKIGAQAFNDCFNLQNVNIPNGVTAIGRAAFWCCHNLSSVTLPKTITEIEDIPFYHCDGIEAFYGKFATQDYDALIKDNKLIAYAQSCGATSYEIPDGVIDIGRDVFSHCADLTSIIIPASVTTIQAWAFNSCSGLTTVNCLGNTPPTYVPNGDVDIASNYYMFYIDAGADKDGNIEHIYVPEGAVEAYKAADYWDKYATFISAGEPIILSNEIWYTTRYNNITSPTTDTFGDAKITSTEFDGDKFVIKFDRKVTKIPKEAYKENISLVSISLPTSVTTIEDSAFIDCNYLRSFSAPGVISVGESAFDGCNSLNTIIFPALETIGRKAFYECSLDTNICLPNVTEIGNSAFCYCGIRNINIPEGVSSIGESAFFKCGSMTSVTLPNSLISIGDSAFTDCTSLTSITIPEGVTEIGGSAFSGCSSLKSVYFANIEALLNVNFEHPASNPMYNGAYLYLGYEIVENLVIPEGVTEIRNYAFHSCISLESVTIPRSVTKIGEAAFCQCI